jgi:hypothetical protein
MQMIGHKPSRTPALENRQGAQRRFKWQDQMAVELKAALAGLAVGAGDVLAGDYLSTDGAPCDAENRLFTNPGTRAHN